MALTRARARAKGPLIVEFSGVFAESMISPGFISDAYGCRIGDQRSRLMSESVATPIVENTKIAPTRGAERMRRCRQRRQQGMRCLTIELRTTEIEVLTRRGYLNAARRGDKHAVLKAVYDFLDDSLR